MAKPGLEEASDPNTYCVLFSAELQEQRPIIFPGRRTHVLIPVLRGMDFRFEPDTALDVQHVEFRDSGHVTPDGLPIWTPRGSQQDWSAFNGAVLRVVKPGDDFPCRCQQR